LAHPIIMPSMGMYSTEGTLQAWLRPQGARVESGEPVAEITTEKATFEIEAPASGLLHTVAATGTELSVSEVMGYILAEGEQPVEAGDGKPSPRGTAAQPHASAAAAAPVQQKTDLRVSPVAKRLAAEHGIDLASVVATGPQGRIVEADVKAAIAARQAAPAPAGPRIRDRIPLAGIRLTIADRMRRSLATAASLTLTREADADKLVAARARMKNADGELFPYDAFFIKLLAAALKRSPQLNASIDKNEIIVFEDINIAFAVPTPAGLAAPVVQNADRKSLAEVSASMRELRGHAVSGSLRPADLDGGTATITNLGANGIDAFTPILNPPQSCILGIGRIALRPVCRDGVLATGHTSVLSLTFDHRVTDGVPAAELLGVICNFMNSDEFYAELTK
jgi:pyruvate dehydrogenase E2 component (dihydrolipoamide acetyltransferase)